MINRQIITNPEFTIKHFDWINDYKDTKNFLYSSMKDSGVTLGQYKKIKIALEMLIRSEPQPTKKSPCINPAKLSKSTTNDIKKYGETMRGVYFTDHDLARMTPEEAFDKWCKHQGEKDLGKWSFTLIKVLTELQNSCVE